MFRARLIPVILLSAACASAEFTPEEKAEIAAQVEGIANATYSMDWASRYAESNPAALSDLSVYGKRLIEEIRKHQRGLLWLIDISGTDSGGAAAEFATLTRAEIVQIGRNLVAGANYEYARGALESMIATYGSNTNLTTALSLVNDAIAARDSFDDTLPFTEPRLDSNLATPGATRDISATAGPHGDYRFGLRLLLNNQSRQLRDSYKNWFEAGEQQETSAMGDSVRDAMLHLHLLQTHIGWQIALAVGAETASLKAHVDQMEAGGTTTRGREFFQILLLQEAALNRVDTQTPQYVEDVNGREMVRGSSYDYTRVCQEAARALRADSALPAYVGDLAWAIESICNGWRDMDNGVYNGTLALKHFQVFAPHPPSEEVCALCSGSGGATCGTGTTEVDGVCVADIIACPTFEGQLDITPDGIVPQCVEVQP